MQLFSKTTFPVSKPWLHLAAGFTWSLVGAMLCWLAEKWLWTTPLFWSLTATAAGLLASIIVYRFGFVKIAHQNRRRIDSLSDRPSFFAFYPVKSYLMVIVMMALGMFLRSSAIPKAHLAVLYLSIGGALFLSSLHYYRPAYQGFKNQPENVL